MRITVTWLSLLFQLSSVFAVNWCDRAYECVVMGKTQKHIMCDPPPKLDGCAIINFVTSPRLPVDTVNFINDVRRNITNEKYASAYGLKKACEMGNISWDSDLAASADRVALSCLTNVNPCRATETFKEVASVTRAIPLETGDETMDPNPYLDYVLRGWRDLFLNANPSPDIVESYREGLWDGGTLMLWAETRSVGCSMVLYRYSKSEVPIYSLVCNYGPAGNILGKKVYETGECTSHAPPSSPEPSTTTASTTTSTTASTTASTTTSTTASTTTSTTAATVPTNTVTASNPLKPESTSTQTSTTLREITPTIPVTDGAARGTKETTAEEDEWPLVSPSPIPLEVISSCNEMKPTSSYLVGHTIFILLTLNRRFSNIRAS